MVAEVDVASGGSSWARILLVFVTSLALSDGEAGWTPFEGTVNEGQLVEVSER